MADLPIEMWHLIFDYFEDLADISACARVDKSLYSAVKSYRIREIAITFPLHYICLKHYQPDPTNHRYQIIYREASILKRSSLNLEHLKRLKICRFADFDLNDVNRFVHLEELDIDLSSYGWLNTRTLSLYNLRVLYVFMYKEPFPWWNWFPYLRLNTRRLTKVCMFNLDKLDFLYPESLRCIETFYQVEKLSKFSNLQYLTFTSRYNPMIQWDILDFQRFQELNVSNLNKLKEIDFHYDYYPFRSVRIWFVFDLWRLRRIIGDLAMLDRPDLKVFWFGVHVTPDRRLPFEFGGIMRNVDMRVEFQLRNHKRLKRQVEPLQHYEFSKWVRVLENAGLDPRSDDIASRVLPKLSFKEISVRSRVFYPELLLQLIAESPGLWSLKFQNSLLDQSFFDRMAEIIQRKSIPLQIFRFFGHYNGLNDFEFLRKLRDLVMLETDQKLSNELVLKLLESHRLDVFRFHSTIIRRLSRRIFFRNGILQRLKKLRQIYGAPDLSGASDEAAWCSLLSL